MRKQKQKSKPSLLQRIRNEGILWSKRNDKRNILLKEFEVQNEYFLMMYGIAIGAQMSRGPKSKSVETKAKREIKSARTNLSKLAKQIVKLDKLLEVKDAT